jgi:hypothetical protein
MAQDVDKASNLVKLSYTTATATRETNDTIFLTSQGIGEVGFEGPKINPRKRFEKHRFVYGTGSMLPGYYANAVSNNLLKKIYSKKIYSKKIYSKKIYSKMKSWNS